MTTIKSLTYDYSSLNKDGDIEVRLDSYAGPIVSRTPTKPRATGTKTELTATFDKPFTGKHDVYIVVMKPDKPNDGIIQLNSIRFNQ